MFRKTTQGRSFGAAACLALLWSAVAPGETVVHVSPDGRDSNPGTASRPVATIGAALDRLRGVEGAREVRLAAGRYPVGATVEIGREDSGSPAAPLRVAGSPGEVVLSGYLPIPSRRWSEVRDTKVLGRVAGPVRGRLMQCEFSGDDRLRLGELSRRGFDADERRGRAPAMLYMGRRPMGLARWPDTGTVVATEVLEAGPVRYGVDEEGWRRFWGEGGTFRIAGDRVARWREPDLAWVNGRFGNAWEWSVNRVRAVREGGEIELAHGEVSGIGADELHPPTFYFENVLEELDQPGEYYIDRERGALYFLPPEGVPEWRSSMRMSWLEEPVMKLAGARHVVLSGLTLEGGRAEGIVVDSGLDIDIKDVRLANLAGDGLQIDGREIRVEGLVAEDLGGRGILFGGGDPVGLRPSGNIVTGSRFVGTGRWDRAFRPAVELVGVGHQVRDCQFSELPHMAIEVKGNDFVIEGCWFNRTCRDFRDMCAIYFNLGERPQMRGTVVRGNLFQDIGVGSDGARGGVYLDNGTMGVSVTDNVFHRVGEGSDGWAVMNHGGAYILVETNVFIDCAVPYHVAYWWNTWGKEGYPEVRERWREILGSAETEAHRAAYPELAKFFEEERVLPDTNTFANNRIANRRRTLRARRGWTSFGGPARTLDARDNQLGAELDGLSFDAYGRPVVPGWRPWKTLAVRAGD